MGEYTQQNRLIQITTTLGPDALLLHSFHGQEGVSCMFHFELRMHSENHGINFDNIIGESATLKIVLPDGKIRYVNGIISSFSQGGSTPLQDGKKPKIFANYYATLVPKLWLLTRTTDCRIFQKKTVPEILEKVFKENGVEDFKN